MAVEKYNFLSCQTYKPELCQGICTFHPRTTSIAGVNVLAVPSHLVSALVHSRSFPPWATLNRLLAMKKLRLHCAKVEHRVIFRKKMMKVLILNDET